MRPKTAPVPPTFILLSVIAMVFLAAGILGLFAPTVVPPLASPKVAWSLIVVAVVMDGAAVVNVVMAVKERAGGEARLNSAR